MFSLPVQRKLRQLSNKFEFILTDTPVMIKIELRPGVSAESLKGGKKMVSGHLQEKKGMWYIVLNYVDEVTRKRKQKWIPTELPVKGNKKRAEAMLADARRDFVPPKSGTASDGLSSDMLFSDFMLTWLEIIRSSVETTTFSSYTNMVTKKIVPYFKEKGITLAKLSARDIQLFYLHELDTVKANTVIHEHANIHKALKYAVKMDLIDFNPADKVDRPKKGKYLADYYNVEEIGKLFEVTKDHYLGLLIRMTAFYGFRRSEVLGLKWNCVDFENDKITVRHIVTQTKVDGKLSLVEADRAKTDSSLRSLPLVPGFKEELLKLKEVQKENKKICGNCYNTEFEGYIFVDQMGNLYRPNTVSDTFKKILEKNGLRHIRFHDLRHSCASLLLANGVSIKEIQEWLGHSDIATTANIYSHLDYSSKISSANVMDSVLKMPESNYDPGWNI